MQQEVNEYIMELMPEVFASHPNLFQDKDTFTDYLEKQKYIREQNEIILTSISEKLIEKFGNKYTVEELFWMQKLFLLYPDETPVSLLKLSWDHVKFILNIFDAKERDFYIQECLANNWTLEELKEKFLLNLYPKYVYVKKKYVNKSFSKELFYDLLFFIW